MMIETKQVRLKGYPNGDKDFRRMYEESQKEVDDLIAFGWQRTEETTQRHGRTTSHYQILARDTSMSHYAELVQLENRYETAKANIKTYNKASAGTAFILLLLFILPGVIYLAVKGEQKSRIKENNYYCAEEMEEAMSEARSLI